jgi:hypothetical protein
MAAPAMLVLAGCTQSAKVQVQRPVSPADQARIGRLLVWLPAGNQLVDPKGLGQAIKSQLADRGIVVETAASQPLELDRRDAQRRIIAAFRPTHLLELEVLMATSGTYSRSALLKATLYKVPGGVIWEGTVSGSSASKLAGAIVEQLATEGLL